MGNENDSTQWTYAGSANVVANPVDSATQIPIDLNLTVLAGDTMGFYLVSPVNSSVKYTDAVSGNEGDVYSDNGDLAILQGSGVSWPFDFVIGPRVWNGTIDYCTGTTGVNEINNSVVSVYPNPFNQSTTFTFHDSRDRSIEVFNITGVLVKRVYIQDSTFTFNKEDLSNGVYSFRILTESDIGNSGRLIIY